MAELSGMFQNLGPTTAALMNGIQAGQQYNENEQVQQARAAQLEKTLQDTRQAEAMNPLLLQAKQQEIASAALKAKAEDHAFHTKLLGEAIPILEKTANGPGQRLSVLNDYISRKRGTPLSEQDLAYYSEQPDLLKTLKGQHEWAVTQDETYRREMDKQRLHNQGAKEVAEIGAKSRADIAAAKASKTAASVEDQAKAGKLSYEKAAVAFNIMAMNADTVEEQQKYQQKAAQYEQLAAKLRAAGNTGKVDVGAATNLPTTGYEPVLMPGATPPANPNNPKVSLPPGWVVKQ
jgi:hypothetical protein